MMSPIEIDTITEGKRFSICSLVTDLEEYALMRASFLEAGFNDDNSEFIYIDNSLSNKHDGYSGINRFLNLAQGKYIILCHQDILLKYDKLQNLEEKIAEMDSIDPDWALLGNAGYRDFNRVALRITDPYGESRNFGPFPAQVKSLDENFILVKRSANLALSHDMNGFHLYGTDLCIFSAMLGYNAYVIDFHLYHRSGGTCGTNFYGVKKQLIEKYQRALSAKYVRTPCTNLFLSNCRFLNYLLNKKIMYSFKKRFDYLYAKLS